MQRKIILSESNFKLLVETIAINESIFEASSLDELKDSLKKLAKKGILISAALIASIVSFYNLTDEEAAEIKAIAKPDTEVVSPAKNETKPISGSSWKLAANDVTATVYNAIPSQCDGDFNTTASTFRLNLYDVSSHRIIAMERTFMKELGLKFGDVVKLEGAGKYDGIYQVQDVMNKRFAGQHIIDILVPEHIKLGEWFDLKLYTLKDKGQTAEIRSTMAPQVSKAEAKRQLEEFRKKIEKEKAEKKKK